MKLLTCGDGVQRSDWRAADAKPVGFCRIYYITGGAVWYRDARGTVELRQNWLYIFPSVRLYAMDHNPQNPISCLWWHIDLFPAVVTDLISIPVEAGSSFHSLLEAMQRCIREGGTGKPSFLMMVEAMVAYCQEHNWLPQSGGRIPEILAYLNANYNREISIGEISSHFHYTPEHFIRLFQRELKLTPYQYLLQRRMREAEAMLLADRPVQEVALQVGYRDAKVFAHRFKQVFGIAPSRYKRFYRPVP